MEEVSSEDFNRCTEYVSSKLNIPLRDAEQIVSKDYRIKVMEQDYFKYLPYEVIFEIALGLKPKSLVNFCFTSKRFSTVCQDEYFWRRKFVKDFPGIRRYKKTYKKSYIWMLEETKLTKLLKIIPESEINWEKLSDNPCLTQNFIELNLDKPWDWGSLGFSSNPVITPEFVERHINEDWDWEEGLSSNPVITPEFVERHINEDWDWVILSDNPAITPEFVERHIDKPWDWEEGLSFNPFITPEFVERHINEDWNWEDGLSENPAITPKFIKAFPNKPWVWGEHGLSLNPSITPKFVERHLDKPWLWGEGGISSNPGITLEFIKSFPNKPWEWGIYGLSSNTFSLDKDHLEPKDVLSRIKGVPENLVEEQVEEEAKKKGISKEKALVKDLTDEFDRFPDELIWTVMLKMDFKSLLSFCSVSRRIKNICDDERFWREKIKIDYSGKLETKDKYVTYKQFYKQLSTENTLERLIKTYPEKDWNFEGLSDNTSITQKLIEYTLTQEFKRKYGAEVNWDFDLLSANPVVTPNFVRKYPNWKWNWDELSTNPSMTMKFIKETSDKPWNLRDIAQYNSNLTKEFVKENMEYARHIVMNKNLC